MKVNKKMPKTYYAVTVGKSKLREPKDDLDFPLKSKGTAEMN